MILFFIDRHWPAIRDNLKSEIMDKLQQIMHSQDVLVQNWTFVCLASIAHQGAPVAIASNQTSSSRRHVGSAHQRQTTMPTSGWERVWSYCLRRMADRETCRAACHAAGIIMAFERMDHIQLVTDLEVFMRDIQVQIAMLPFDSTCTFLTRCLDMAAKDLHLFQLQLPRKVLDWLINGWNPLLPTSISATSYRGHACFSPELVNLLRAISGLQSGQLLRSDTPVPNCSIAQALSEHMETRAVRDWALSATVCPVQCRVAGSGPVTSTVEGDPVSASATRRPQGHDISIDETPPNSLQMRLAAFLQGILDSAPVEFDGSDGADWSTARIYRLRTLLYLAVLSLLYDGVCQISGIRSQRPMVVSACRVLKHAASCINRQILPTQDRAALVQGLSPLLLRIDPVGPALLENVMVNPGLNSGIKRELLSLQTAFSSSDAANTSEASILRRIWQTPDTQSALTQVVEVLKARLTRESPIADGDHRTEDIYGFRGASATTADCDVLSITDADAADTVCIRGILTLAVFRGNLSTVTSRAPDLVNAVVCSNPVQSLIAGVKVSEALRSGLMTLSPSEVDAILLYFGDQLLPSHKYGRNEHVHLVVLQFLDATTCLWASEDPSVQKLAKNARQVCAWFAALFASGKIGSWRTRLHFAAFCDHYLTFDLSGKYWIHADQAGVYEDEDANGLLPSGILHDMLRDIDFRVRFYACTAIGRLFERLPRSHAIPILVDMGQRLCTDLDDEPEKIITSIQATANAMIASAAARQPAYSHLIMIASATPAFHRWIETALQVVALQLGLGTLANFYVSMADFVVRRQIESTNEHARRPLAERVCGFETRKACVDAVFPTTGAILLDKREDDMFTLMCTTAGLSNASGRTLCFSQTAALCVLRAFEASTDPVSPPDLFHQLSYLLNQTELPHAHGLPHDGDSSVALRSTGPRILLAMINLLGEEDCAADGPVFAAFFTHDSSDAAAVYRSLVDLQRPRISQPPHPSFTAAVVIRSCRWLSDQFDIFDRPSALYDVLQSLLTSVASAPFVDTQLRHLCCICVCIALGRASASHSRILRLLMHAMVILLSQSDLMPFCKSILAWIVSNVWQSSSKPFETFGSLLVAEARTAERYIRDINPDIRALGAAVLNTLEKQVGHGTQHHNDELRAQAFEAACQWPAIENSLAESTFSNVNMLLQKSDNRGIMAFNMVRPLAQLRAQAQPEEIGSVIWTLLRVLGNNSAPVELLQAVAFMDLLFASQGSVLPPRLGQLRSREFNREPPTTECEIQLAIVGHLAGLLHAQDLTLVDRASRALRNLCALYPHKYDTVGINMCDAAKDLELISDVSLIRPWEARTIDSSRSIDELSSEEMIRLSTNVVHWSRVVAVLLAEVRGVSERFYAQLVPLLQTHDTFAAVLLPLLVHSLLLHELAEGGDRSSMILSRHFASVLTNGLTSEPCIRLIVDLTAVLRSSPKSANGTKQGQIDSASSADLWLPSLGWGLLGKGAARCGSYLTALMFSELAHEYDVKVSKDLSIKSGLTPTESRDLLYEIYAHIDEVDGFYGIHSDDLSSSLLQRYQHEARWQSVFELRGTLFEGSLSIGASSPESGQFVPLIQSLSSGGFNRLALHLLQPLGNTGHASEQDIPDELPYELAWRSETWDVPPVDFTSNPSSSGTIYTALRSIHRERDANHTGNIIDAAICSEVSKLSTLDLDNPMGSPVLGSLLCLREARRWHRAPDSLISFEPFVTVDQTARYVVGADFARYTSVAVLTVRKTRLDMSMWSASFVHVSAFCGPSAAKKEWIALVIWIPNCTMTRLCWRKDVSPNLAPGHERQLNYKLRSIISALPMLLREMMAIQCRRMLPRSSPKYFGPKASIKLLLMFSKQSRPAKTAMPGS